MDLLADLNEPQCQAVQHVDGPLLVLAGAGSGKTRVITRRTAYLIQQGIAPRHLLAITFTNKAAEEMRERVAALGVPPGATICTFHSLCARVLREFADDARLQGNYSIYDRADQLRVTKDAIARAEIGESLSPAGVHGAISRAKNDLKTPDLFEAEASSFYQRNVAKVYREYQRLLETNNAVDFDDLLLRVSLMLRDLTDIREMLGRRYRYILVDEYQDTNRAQYIIAHGIAMDHKNLCVTGDPDQSIYAWRGADISNILEFEKDHPDAVVIRLEQNYRSSRPILAAASRLIDHNTTRKAKTLWTTREGGRDVQAVLCDDEKAEAQLVVRRLADFRDEGGDLDDAAVFYRLNSLSRVLEEALVSAGMPYRIARGVEFYNRKVVKDLLAYLRLLINPADDLSCRRAINTPARGIGAKTVDRLANYGESRGIGILGACELAGETSLGPAARKKARGFWDLIASLAGDVDRRVRDILEDVVRHSGMEAVYSGEDEDARQARANIDELVTTARQFDDRGIEGGLADYLHQIGLASDTDHYDGGARSAVTLMTLHAAKGLEFPCVFVVGCEDGLLPFRREDDSPWSTGTGTDIEEERRLAFVGMTRAKDLLTLTGARSRMVRGRYLPRAVSQFLYEISGEGVSLEDATTDPPRRPGRRAGGMGGGFYADVAERERIEARGDAEDQAVARAMQHDHLDEPVPPELEHLRAGCRVQHRSYGGGKVVKIGTQPWPNTRVDVAFDTVGVKRLVLAKASLELEEHWD